jgi:DNA-binding MarR family transcriptional regulator
VAGLALGAFCAARVSAGGAAALVALSAAGDLSVNELGCRVGLSQPAAVRMVDSLEVGGLMPRGQR